MTEKKTVTIRMHRVLFDDIEIICKEEIRGVNNAIEWLLSSSIEEYKNSHPLLFAKKHT